MTSGAAREREALRQQMMLRVLWRDARPGVLAGWTRDGSRFGRGLQAYQAGAGALAERALAAAYPVVRELLGEESFAALARALWHAEPPSRGDVAQWGDALPGFAAAAAQLKSEPYLPDLARLEWALHRALSVADPAADPSTDPSPGDGGLGLLAEAEPAALRLRLAAGSALVESVYPIVTVWQAHQSEAPTRFDAAREAFAEARGESAWVWRDGWRPRVERVTRHDLGFTRALLEGSSLGAALDRADAGFSFEAWLVGALKAGRITGAEPLKAMPTP